MTNEQAAAMIRELERNRELLTTIAVEIAELRGVFRIHTENVLPRLHDLEEFQEDTLQRLTKAETQLQQREERKNEKSRDIKTLTALGTGTVGGLTAILQAAYNWWIGG